jgi:hypothetical protein
VHNHVTLWFKGQQMQAIGTLKDYGVKVSLTSAVVVIVAAIYQ